MPKTNSIKIIIPVFIVLVLVVYFSYLKEGKTQTGSLSLKGWALVGADCTDSNELTIPTTDCSSLQTSPVGWVSLSSDNPGITCGSTSYGVNVDVTSGEISGAAWIGIGEDDTYTNCNTTENTVGWLYFDSTSTPPCGTDGYPSDYCFPAKAVGSEIQGWAPIISKDYLGNATTVTWVRFKGDNYSVNIDPSDGRVTGFAWSNIGKEGGLGWIKFLAAVPTTSKAILNVQSLPSGVPITASDSFFSGTTDYSRSSTGTISNLSLTAPMAFSGYNFDHWDGCNSSSDNICNVSVTLGGLKTVTAVYTSVPTTATFDLSVNSLDISTFICKNGSFDLGYLHRYLALNPSYQFPASTTYATEFYNKVASSTCPESQRNRPVEFSARGICMRGSCPDSKLRIYIRSLSPLSDQEIKTFETPYNSSYPKSITGEYIFNKPYDYVVTAELVDNNNNPIDDMNNSNNRKEQTLRIFDYMCLLGFCSQNQRDINNPSSIFNSEPLMYKILKIFSDTDSPCRFYRNDICRAKFGF